MLCFGGVRLILDALVVSRTLQLLECGNYLNQGFLNNYIKAVLPETP